MSELNEPFGPQSMSATATNPRSLIEIQAAIELIEQLELGNASIDGIKPLLRPFFEGYIVSTPLIDSRTYLYRLRPFPYEKPSHVCALGAPPSIAVLNLQRCNRIGEPMFYCSVGRNGPFFEVHAKVGETFVLSIWRTNRNLLVNNVGYTRAAFAALKSNRGLPMWAQNKYEQETSDSVNVAIDEFLAGKFTQDVPRGSEHLYKVTVGLTDYFIRGGGTVFDGLCYPTIAMWGNADNLALTPACASNGLDFFMAEHLRITRIEGSEMTFDLLDTASTLGQGGVLNWTGYGSQLTWSSPAFCSLLDVRK
jgi:hypothetical protein